jgi:hypothetical protein
MVSPHFPILISRTKPTRHVRMTREIRSEAQRGSKLRGEMSMVSPHFPACCGPAGERFRLPALTLKMAAGCIGINGHPLAYCIQGRQGVASSLAAHVMSSAPAIGGNA